MRYGRPRPGDRDHDAAGRLTAEAIVALGVPRDADVRMCGPSRFVADLTAGLLEHGFERERITSESFGGAPAAPPAAARAAAHAPLAGSGPAVALHAPA